MPAELGFLTALLVGILGSSHCLGMCSGIVGALNMGLEDSRRQSRFYLFAFQLAYNSGRIISYVCIGALAGWLGSAFSWSGFDWGPLPGKLIAAAFMVALGLYLTNWWRGLALLERAGARLWKHIQPWGRGLLPVQHPLQALLLGMLWGWLPCGLVYAVLAWSLTTASVIDGALVMLGFGLGTLPSMLLLGGLITRYKGRAGRPLIRSLAGIAIIVLGLYGGLSSLYSHQQQHHLPGSASIDLSRR